MSKVPHRRGNGNSPSQNATTRPLDSSSNNIDYWSTWLSQKGLDDGPDDSEYRLPGNSEISDLTNTSHCITRSKRNLRRSLNSDISEELVDLDENADEESSPPHSTHSPDHQPNYQYYDEIYEAFLRDLISGRLPDEEDDGADLEYDYDADIEKHPILPTDLRVEDADVYITKSEIDTLTKTAGSIKHLINKDTLTLRKRPPKKPTTPPPPPPPPVDTPPVELHEVTVLLNQFISPAQISQLQDQLAWHFQLLIQTYLLARLQGYDSITKQTWGLLCQLSQLYKVTSSMLNAGSSETTDGSKPSHTFKSMFEIAGFRQLKQMQDILCSQQNGHLSSQPQRLDCGVITMAQADQSYKLFQQYFNPHLSLDLQHVAKLNGKNRRAANVDIIPSVTPSSGSWRPSEDTMLTIGYERYNEDFDAIHARLLPWRDTLQIQSRLEELTVPTASDGKLKQLYAAQNTPFDQNEMQIFYSMENKLLSEIDFAQLSATSFRNRHPLTLKKMWKQLLQERQQHRAQMKSIANTRKPLSKVQLAVAVTNTTPTNTNTVPTTTPPIAASVNAAALNAQPAPTTVDNASSERSSTPSSSTVREDFPTFEPPDSSSHFIAPPTPRSPNGALIPESPEALSKSLRNFNWTFDSTPPKIPDARMARAQNTPDRSVVRSLHRLPQFNNDWWNTTNDQSFGDDAFADLMRGLPEQSASNGPFSLTQMSFNADIATNTDAMFVDFPSTSRDAPYVAGSSLHGFTPDTSLDYATSFPKSISPARTTFPTGRTPNKFLAFLESGGLDTSFNEPSNPTNANNNRGEDKTGDAEPSAKRRKKSASARRLVWGD